MKKGFKKKILDQQVLTFKVLIFVFLLYLKVEIEG